MTGGLRASFPTTTELRAMGVALRGGPTVDGAAEAAARSPDDQLVALFETPFDSVADADRRLARAAVHLRARDDRRSVFATIYASMTARVAAGIAAGDFADPAWMRRYLVDFADRYRTAMLAHEQGHEDAVPAPWRLAVDAAAGGHTLLLQDALLGVNAHINYDLPYALDAVGIDPDRAAKRRDHDRINAILAGLVDVVQRTLTERYDAAGYGDLDAALGGVDEALTLFGLREARDLAWRNAVGLTDAPFDLLWRFVRWRIRLLATGAGHVILAPTGDLGVRDALRAAEDGDLGVESLVEEVDERCRDATIELS